MSLSEKQGRDDEPMNQQKHEPVPQRLPVRAPGQKINREQIRSCICCSTFAFILLALAVALEAIILVQSGWLEGILKQLVISGKFNKF